MIARLASCILPLTFVTSLRLSASKLSAAMSSGNNNHKLVVDAFCIRQFNNADYTGSQIHFPVEEFEKKVNEYFETGTPLVDGYAPFW
jgi:hypothetical protein